MAAFGDARRPAGWYGLRGCRARCMRRMPDLRRLWLQGGCCWRCGFYSALPNYYHKTTKNARIVDKSCKEEESNVSMYCFEEDVNIDCMAKYEEDACSIDPSKIKSVT